MKLQDFFDREEKWTQGAFGYFKGKSEADAGGFRLAIEHGEKPSACCLMGAIRFCYGYGDEASAVIMKLNDALSAPDSELPEDYIVEWNDFERRTFEAVEQIIRDADV